MGIDAPPPAESADSCQLKECYICELGKPIATDLLLNTTSWTSILKLVLAVLHSSDLGRSKEYFSNNEITQFVYCHWERISGSKKWSKEWKSRISDCLSHNKKSFESHERGKWRMKDMSQVGGLIDKLKRLHFQTSTPLSPTLSPESSPIISRSGARRSSFDGQSSLSPNSSPRPYIKDEKSLDNDTPSSPFSISQEYSPPSPSSQSPYHAPPHMTAHRERRNSYHPYSIPYLHLNDTIDSPPSSPVYLSPRTTPPSHHQNYPAAIYSQPSYQHPPPPTPSHNAFINLPPPTPTERERPVHNFESDAQYYSPNSYYPQSSYYSPTPTHYSPRWPAYTHSVDRDMVDLFNRKSSQVS